MLIKISFQTVSHYKVNKNKVIARICNKEKNTLNSRASPACACVQ